MREGQTNNKAKQHSEPKQQSLFLRKMSCSGGTPCPCSYCQLQAIYIYHYDCRKKEKSSREEIQTSFNQAYGDVKR